MCRRGPQSLAPRTRRVRVGELTSEEAAAVLAAVVLGRVEPGDRFGDQPVGDDGPHADPVRRACRRPTSHRPSAGVGSAGRPVGPARRGPGRGGPFPQLGVAVQQVQCVGHQVPGRGRCPAHRGGQASGANAATAGVPSPPSVSSASSTPTRAARGLDPGVGGGGVQDRPWEASARRRTSIRRDSISTRCGFGEHAGGVEVSDLDRSPGAALIGLAQASTTDSRRPQKPLSTRDLRNCPKKSASLAGFRDGC